MPGGRRSPIDRALREYARVRRHVGPGRSITLDEAVHVSERLSRRDFGISLPAGIERSNRLARRFRPDFQWQE